MIFKKKNLQPHSHLKTFFIVFTLFFCQIVCKAQTRALKTIQKTAEQKSEVAFLTPTEDSEFIMVEAEDFTKQKQTSKRKWRLVTPKKTPKSKADRDGNHCDGASGSKYLELLPDTLYDDNESRKEEVNVSKLGGKMAVLSYDINFIESGKYYVWGRAFANNGDDNTIHVGVDGTWPTSGEKMYWCMDLLKKWSWASVKFDGNEHCGVNKRTYINIGKPGMHTIMFSMREDGFEFDKFALTKDSTKKPI